jgi:hypothetical protein
MRKMLWGGVLGFGLLMAAFSWGATTPNGALTFGILINVAAAPIDLTGVTTDVSWGTFPLGGRVFSNLPQGQPRSTVTQNGYATINLGVSASIAAYSPGGGNWTLVPTMPPGPNQARLSGIFTAPLITADVPAAGEGFYAYDLTAADFADDDVIIGTMKVASATVFSRPNELEMFHGYNVTPATPTRNLRYMVDLPTAVTTSGPQRISVTISGVVP